MTERPSIAGAMARADSAHQKIDSHEELCAERYKNILDGMGDLKNGLIAQRTLLQGILLGIAGFAVTTLVAVALFKIGLLG